MVILQISRFAQILSVPYRGKYRAEQSSTDKPIRTNTIRALRSKYPIEQSFTDKPIRRILSVPYRGKYRAEQSFTDKPIRIAII